MKKILVPTDFSENAYNALEYGVKLFAEENCIFYILYSYTPALYNSDYLSDPTVSINEVFKRDGLRSISKVVKRIKQDVPNEKHKFKKISSFDFLQDEIRNQVKLKGIDLVIMGTQGATGAVQILFGSHTINAIKGATCPVLAVPANFKFTTLSNILFPSDYESGLAEEELTILKDIAERFQSRIHILHVTNKLPLTQEQKRIKKRLSVFLKNTFHEFEKMEKQTLHQGIFRYQEIKPIDLLVMVKFKKTFFQNLFYRPVINKIGFHLSTPFLIIPIGEKKPKNANYEKDTSTHRLLV